MDAQQFGYCCGMAELGDLDGTVSELKHMIASRLAMYENERDINKEDGFTYETPGGLIATTIESQRGAIAALKFHKFKKVLTFTNPGTDNKVTLWAKKLVR